MIKRWEVPEHQHRREFAFVCQSHGFLPILVFYQVRNVLFEGGERCGRTPICRIEIAEEQEKPKQAEGCFLGISKRMQSIFIVDRNASNLRETVAVYVRGVIIPHQVTRSHT